MYQHVAMEITCWLRKLSDKIIQKLLKTEFFGQSIFISMLSDAENILSIAGV